MESKGMFEKNLRFAYWYVRKHFPMYADDEDIMQEALIGLCRKDTIVAQNAVAEDT